MLPESLSMEISLVAPELPVVALVTQQKLVPAMMENIREISARGKQCTGNLPQQRLPR